MEPTHTRKRTRFHMPFLRTLPVTNHLMHLLERQVKTHLSLHTSRITRNRVQKQKLLMFRPKLDQRKTLRHLCKNRPFFLPDTSTGNKTEPPPSARQSNSIPHLRNNLKPRSEDSAITSVLPATTGATTNASPPGVSSTKCSGTTNG